MVEGVHALIRKGAVGVHAVPTLPDGSGAHGDGVQPGGIVRFQQQVHREGILPRQRQGVQQMGGPDKAGGEAAEAAHVIRQLAGRGGGVVGETENQRQHHGGL